jgi:hypothetical protein
MKCQATPRAVINDPGWFCTGTDLITVLHASPPEGGDPLPLVVPNWALEQVMRESQANVFDAEPFAGGDHMHYVVKNVAMERHDQLVALLEEIRDLLSGKS